MKAYGDVKGELFPKEEGRLDRMLADAATGGLDGRLAPPQTAARLLAEADAAARAAGIPLASAPAGEQKRLKELVTVCGQVAHLGRYYAERFMAATRAAQADVIVSGDHHLLNLKSYKKIAILSPRQFCEMIGEAT